MRKPTGSSQSIEVSVDTWARVTDYRWSLEPLSSSGSLKGIGGRFNIGQDLDRARTQFFPALYLAENLDTAFCEFFGGPPHTDRGRLSLQEFALRRATSFTTFALRGRVENVFDLTSSACLRQFVGIVAGFQLSADTRRLARKMNLRQRTLIRTPKDLWAKLLVPPKQWRTEPQLFGIPAASQIFGRFLRDAGFDAVLYPSQQGGTRCLAVFPENFSNSSSRIEVSGGAPEGASKLVLDKNSLCLNP
ncbi:MAG TPA: RES family NAD+ phosphorylase [Steroidobacteraceae bacterium]|nr:RES family NAD+ phosphorylase [Steroidobacteraceae bacterium]